MSLASDSVTIFRSFWADRFVDTVSIDRHAADGTFNATTLVYDAATTSNVYSGGALLRPAPVTADEELANELRTVVAFDVYLPHTATGIQPEDIVTVSASVTESDLVGQTMRVTAILPDSYNTRRHLKAELDYGSGSGRG